mmetsp:Transcript_45582/g.74282  ORF Transcript_45582/g.74282 Transcript_45582/m.74282 type:complete len:175 (-) Transcript_45582:165-689(-)
MPGETRSKPNILVSGTPGTGKTSLCEIIALHTRLKHVNIGDLVRSRQLHDGWDEEFESYIIDEDRVVDELEDEASRGGLLVDHHGVDFFPERWFDLVVVLRTQNDVLYPRLEARQYNAAKMNENIEAEIMQVVLDEARDSYGADKIMELQSNTVEQMEENAEIIESWVRAWSPM